MSTSYINYHHLNYYSSADMATTDDYSIVMLDMANSDFRDEYADSPPNNDMFPLYRDADAAIYDAEFLKKLALDYPQYNHVICTISPRDPKRIKEVYHAILDHYYQTQQPATCQSHQCRSSKGEKIISVFDGSYDERIMKKGVEICEQDGCDVGDDKQVTFEFSSVNACDQLPDAIGEECEEDDEDTDYVDPSYQRWLKTFVRPLGHCDRSARGGKVRPRARREMAAPYVEQLSSPMRGSSAGSDDDDDDDVPALSPDIASSPELHYIDTPTSSPDVKKNQLSELSILPGFHSEKRYSVLGKAKPALGGYTVTSDNLIIASWGRENGRTCRALSIGGFECSCSHRAATMGDMARHWQSKRHSSAAFGCQGCGKAYTRDDALKRHMRRSGECSRKVRKS